MRLAWAFVRVVRWTPVDLRSTSADGVVDAAVFRAEQTPGCVFEYSGPTGVLLSCSGGVCSAVLAGGAGVLLAVVADEDVLCSIATPFFRTTALRDSNAPRSGVSFGYFSFALKEK
ncbi:hypothetical protein [Trichloromonas sp.]|uniref:hypothetical protein n=1 Tax=Trichloromonas sp. TaxID=3069249 RepID=UPI003D816D60